MIMIGEEFKKRLVKEEIDPLSVVSFTTENDKYKRTIITTITFNDGTKRELIDNYTWYAARKNKRW